MNSKLIKASLAGVAAIAVTAGGTTFAAWSDFHEWNGNDSGAGTLTLNVGSPDSQKFNVGNLTPGQVWEQEWYMLSNESDSTPNGKMYLTLDNILGSEDGCQGSSEAVDDTDGCTVAADPVGEFPENAEIFIKTKSSNETTCGVAPVGGAPAGYEKGIYGVLDLAGTNVAAKSIADLQSDGRIQLVRPGALNLPTFDPAVFKPGEGVCVNMHVYLPQTANNAVQGDSATFDLQFDLEQAF